ncbi:MAG: molybdopterin-binding protein [Hyphomicrobiales bacterium]|nr:molybdopterin-binding protein [Hyphomicrobiales bacterium]
MKFGPVPVAESLGGIIAHAVRRDGLMLKKGTLVGAREHRQLLDAGITSVMIARLEPGDIGEDEAASRLALALAGAHVKVEAPFTGRANLFADTAGLLIFESATIDAINAPDERITVATLGALKAVVEGEMVGTVKIIPFALEAPALESALTRCGSGLRIAPFRAHRVAVISTVLPSLKPATIEKTLRVTEDRLTPLGSSVVAQAQVAHETEALTRAILDLEHSADLLIIFGASAISDRLDVIPSALVAAGGSVTQLGMPVDPGNLLLLGRTSAGTPVIGAPGCARSPRENGFDFVLQRLLAGVEVSAASIRAMGAGGLMMEIISRPQPRGGGGSGE